MLQASITSGCSLSTNSNASKLTYIEKSNVQLQLTSEKEKDIADANVVEKEENELQLKLNKQHQRLLLEEKRKEELEKQEELKRQEELKMQEQLKVQEEQKKQEELKKQAETKKQAPTSIASNTSQSNRLIDRIKSAGDSQQAILVQANSFGTCRVNINTYEKINGSWKEVYSNISGVVGIKGFSTNRHEGDLTSPVGTFSIPYLFGWGGNAGFKMTYKASNQNDYWVSDSVLERYNVWIHREGGPDPTWKDYEALGTNQPLYKYAAVINYNMGPNKVMGKGSGMFLHITPLSGGGTLGCTAMPESNLVQVLRWLDHSKNPVIIQGPTSELNKM